MITITLGGEIVARSKNLRCIGAYRRKSGSFLWLHQRGRLLRCEFEDGAVCETEFADASVLKEWIANRVRYGRGQVEEDCGTRDPT